ncbi:hypothetical protein ACIPRU_31270 [Streptomyces sp. NPDC090126]|uniref:hypothetical protein n=1 Tax=Streptomyces sp. NPDC090126 TaxID=3365952 RepID=UPI0038053F5F
MFELSRRLTTPLELEKAQGQLVRGIEVFAVGTIAAATLPPTPASLIERAWVLETYTDWLRWGPSGMSDRRADRPPRRGRRRLPARRGLEPVVRGRPRHPRRPDPRPEHRHRASVQR